MKACSHQFCLAVAQAGYDVCVAHRTDRQLCGAKRANGKPCRSFVKKGSDFCGKHALPPQAEPAKLRELVLYVARECEADPEFDVTKLWHFLFQADFTSYRETGQSITGCHWQKTPEGPRPVWTEVKAP